MNRDKIVKFCADYLRVDDFSDGCVNGLQVEGGAEVNRIITSVSFSRELIEMAIEKKAQMIMVHHGIFSNQTGMPPKILSVIRQRLKLLLENDISLCGFHLPLDAHPVIGNNISLCKLLGVKKVKPFDVGFYGELAESMEFKLFSEMVARKLDAKLYIMNEGKSRVKKIGIISGGASPDYLEASKLGLDVFICGDIREDVFWGIKEVKINFINAGHYNTEKLGIQNLGKLIAKKFKIEVEFVDIPCDI